MGPHRSKRWLYINKKILNTRSERVKRKLRAEYVRKDKKVKKIIKVDKRKWIDNITGEAEKAARKQNMKTLYGLTKTLRNERPRQSTVVLDKNGNLVSGKEEVQSRWTEPTLKKCLIEKNQKTR